MEDQMTEKSHISPCVQDEDNEHSACDLEEAPNGNGGTATGRALLAEDPTGPRKTKASDVKRRERRVLCARR